MPSTGKHSFPLKTHSLNWLDTAHISHQSIKRSQGQSWNPNFYRGLQTLRGNLKTPSASFQTESFQLKHKVKKFWKINLWEKRIQVPACSEHFIHVQFYSINILFLDCLIGQISLRSEALTLALGWIPSTEIIFYFSFTFQLKGGLLTSWPNLLGTVWLITGL